MVISFVFLTACRDTESKSNKKIEQNQETFTNKKTDIPFSDKIFDNIVKIETGKTYPLQEIKNKAVIQNICSVLKELKVTPNTELISYGIMSLKNNIMTSHTKKFIQFLIQSNQ